MRREVKITDVNGKVRLVVSDNKGRVTLQPNDQKMTYSYSSPRQKYVNRKAWRKAMSKKGAKS